MNATPDDKPERDFSAWALLRGAIAATVSAHFLFAIFLPIIISGVFVGHAWDPAWMLDRLHGSLHPASLILGLAFMSVASVVGLAFLAGTRRDHTTYRAAAIAGARSGALCVGLILLAGAPGLASQLFRNPGAFLAPEFWAGALSWAWLVLGIALIGAASGLVFRAAVGAPTLTSQRTPTPPEP